MVSICMPKAPEQTVYLRKRYKGHIIKYSIELNDSEYVQCLPHLSITYLDPK